MRTNLRFVARRVVPALARADAPLPRERAKAPYSPPEIGGYLALAAAQPTVAGRMRAAGLVCLGAGAGLTGADLRAARGSDVICRSGGVVVEVRGARPRVVPVLARYHDPLLAAAQFAGTQLITGGTDPARKNIATPLIRSLSGGTGLPPLETARLRSTWLAGDWPWLAVSSGIPPLALPPGTIFFYGLRLPACTIWIVVFDSLPPAAPCSQAQHAEAISHCVKPAQRRLTSYAAVAVSVTGSRTVLSPKSATRSSRPPSAST